MAHELTDADKFILATLKANASLVALIGGVTPRIYPDVAPADTAFPYVLFAYQASAPPIEAIGVERVAMDPTYLIQAVTKTTTWGGQSEQIVTAIDAAMHAKSGSVSGGGYVYIARRTTPYRDLEEIGAERIRHAGWYYRLLVKATPLAAP